MFLILFFQIVPANLYKVEPPSFESIGQLISGQTSIATSGTALSNINCDGSEALVQKGATELSPVHKDMPQYFVSPSLSNGF